MDDVPGKWTSLSERVGRLEDLEAVRDVTARYAMATNKGVEDIDVDAFPSIFAPDATWEARGVRVAGLDAMMKRVRESTASLVRSIHAFVNPVLDLDGDRASGRWILLLVGHMAGKYHHGYSTEDFTYARTAAGWRIQSVRLHPGLIFPLPAALQPSGRAAAGSDHDAQGLAAGSEGQKRP